MNMEPKFKVGDLIVLKKSNTNALTTEIYKVVDIDTTLNLYTIALKTWSPYIIHTYKIKFKNQVDYKLYKSILEENLEFMETLK